MIVGRVMGPKIGSAQLPESVLKVHETFTHKLWKEYDEILGKQEFLNSSGLTLPDFMLGQVVIQAICILKWDMDNQYPNVVKYLNRLCGLIPNMKKDFDMMLEKMKSQ